MSTFINNPPNFKAFGRGWYNRLPNIVADESNASGKLTLQGTKGAISSVYLFVTDIELGWTVSGDYGQSKGYRTFYPKNLHQTPVQITGVVANQYEYDRLVEFVSKHHRNVIQDATYVCNFKLFPFRILLNPESGKPPIYRWVVRPMNFDGVVMAMDAGHERFKNAPTWSIQFMVTYDYLSPSPVTDSQTDLVLKQNWEQIFGAAFTQSPTTVGTPQPVSSGNNPDVDLTDTIDLSQFSVSNKIAGQNL